MDATLVYALLSGHAYGAKVQVRSSNNTVPLPQDWIELEALRDFNSGTGYMARVYQNALTQDVVIAYGGTTYEDGLDWPFGNIPGGIGQSLAPQILDAAKLYLRVRDQLPAGTSISFTGHSLGGGLASLMSVFFDRPATVFDSAPFRLSADTGIVVNALKEQLALAGYSIGPEFQAYQPGVVLSYPISGPAGVGTVWGGYLLQASPTRLERQSRIQLVRVAGEALSGPFTLGVALLGGISVLAPLAVSVGRFFGSETVLDPQARFTSDWNALAPVDLHDITLLTALHQSSTLLDASRAQPLLLPAIFTSALEDIRADDESQTKFLELMVQRDVANESSLDAFARDVLLVKREGLTGLDVFTQKEHVARAILSATIAGHYKQGVDRTASPGSLFEPFLSEFTGGVGLDLRRARSEDLTDARDRMRLHLGSPRYPGDQVDLGAGADKDAWVLQTGTGPIDAQGFADTGNLMIGWTGNDRLKGGANDDLLLGDAGDDKLEGEGGQDTLVGGAGRDELSGGADADVLVGGRDRPLSGDDWRLPDYVRFDFLDGGEGADELYGDDKLEDDRNAAFAGNDFLLGGAGADTLFGGRGGDYLFGGADDDYLRGNGESDLLDGGTGFDTYAYFTGDGSDRIIDAREGGVKRGEILVDGAPLTGGGPGYTTFLSTDGRFRYFFKPTSYGDGAAPGSRLLDPRVDIGPLAISLASQPSKVLLGVPSFKNGDLGITLTFRSPLPHPELEQSPPAEVRGDPLVLDLDGTGLATVGLDKALRFDLDANGFKERTGWIAPGKGVLVLDANADGLINDGTELFGDFTPTGGGRRAVNGFQALSQHDRNGDGVIDAADPIFSELRVWTYDRDPVAGETLYLDPDWGGRLLTLEEAGIRSIRLASSITNATDGNGNTKTRGGLFERADGTTAELAEYRFARDLADSEALGVVVVDADLSALPDLPGSGSLRDLQQAMQDERNTLGTNTLKAFLDAFVGEADPTARYGRFEALLFKWAGVDGVDPASRGSYLDARKLGVLEESYGQALGTPDYWHAVSWDNTYRDLTEGFYASLLRETHFASLYAQITYSIDPATGAERGDLSAVIAALQAGLVTDPVKGRQDVIEFARSIRGLQLQDPLGYLNFRETFVGADRDFAFELDSAAVRRVSDAEAQSYVFTDFSEAVRVAAPRGSHSGAGDDIVYGPVDAPERMTVQGLESGYSGVLVGGTHSDALWGSAGADLLDGWGTVGDALYPEDTLLGEGGDDTYIFRRGYGALGISDSARNTPSDADTLFMGGDLTPADITVRVVEPGAVEPALRELLHLG